MKVEEVIANLTTVNNTDRDTDLFKLIDRVAEKGYETEARVLRKCIIAKNEPLDKDLKRMKDLKKRSGKDQVKAVKYAKTQAKKIEDASKAQRRAKAAKSIIKGKMGDAVAKVFQARYNWLRILEA